MKDASQYPVTFGYGATDGTYYGPNGSIGLYHRGDDRAMPVGTPVAVNGVQIGLSGSGNGRYGPHLHVGKFVNGKDVNPNGRGFNLEGARVITVVTDYSTDPVNAKYVRIQDASGTQWVYLHMSQVDVKVGQSLTEKEEEMSQAVVDDLYKKVDQVNKDIASLRKLIDDVNNSVDANNKAIAKELNRLNNGVDNLNKAVFK